MEHTLQFIIFHAILGPSSHTIFPLTLFIILIETRTTMQVYSQTKECQLLKTIYLATSPSTCINIGHVFVKHSEQSRFGASTLIYVTNEKVSLTNKNPETGKLKVSDEAHEHAML